MMYVHIALTILIAIMPMGIVIWMQRINGDIL